LIHHEYAVEPKVIGSNWQNFRYILEKFGFDKGRLIAEFPRQVWFREVYNAASGFPPTQRARLEILLKQARGTKVIRTGRPYNQNLDWLSNALTEHQRLPFQAIIAQENGGGSEAVLLGEELDEQHPRMVVANPISVPRDAPSIASALSALLEHGSRVLVVDPFFDPFNGRYKSALRACLLAVKAGNPQTVCEIHYRYHVKASSPTDIERAAWHLFPGLIPDGMSIKIFCWKEKDGGADFHARYLLTEKGGIAVDAGFSAEGAHQMTDMHRMDAASCIERAAAFDKAATVYELIGNVLLISAAGQVTHA
jgi:hypothetical protein